MNNKNKTIRKFVDNWDLESPPKKPEILDTAVICAVCFGLIIGLIILALIIEQVY